MKLLTFTSLYPNAEMPGHGVFVENRLAHLVSSGRVSTSVIAPVPWFPFASKRFGRFGASARVPRHEARHGIEIAHPRYIGIPGVGGLTAPLAMALSARRLIARRIAAGERFDAIDAHYFFPDGVAAALLGRWFRLPVVITARGSDINVNAQQPLSRSMILWAARSASAIITVSRSLQQAVIGLGVAPSKVIVLRNGVDTECFVRGDRLEARLRWGLDPHARTIVSVGRLVRLKGHDLVITALASLPGAQLAVVGSGPERSRLMQQAIAEGVADRVHFIGQVQHDALSSVYSAADALVLASSNEGWPNVLLESMACGTPVVATDVGGCNEIVAAPEVGIVIRERSADAVAAALSNLFAREPAPQTIRRYAERFGWDETSRGQERLFHGLQNESHRAASAFTAT